MQSAIKKQLLALNLRVPEDIAVICIKRFERGDTRYSVCHGPDKIIGSSTLADKLHRLWKEGQFQFLIEDYNEAVNDLVTISAEGNPDTTDDNPGLVEDVARARHDGFRFTRYNIVAEAERRCPDHYFSTMHLRSLGLAEGKLFSLIEEYLELNLYRQKAEIWTTIHHFDDRKPRPTMANFPSLGRYLYILYMVYALTETEKYKPTNPDKKWNALSGHYDQRFQYLHHAAELWVKGQLESDEHLCIAADDVIRFNIWEHDMQAMYFDSVAETAYFKSLKRLKRNAKGHDKFVTQLRRVFRGEIETWLKED